MADVRIDSIETLNISEQYGVYTRLTRMIKVLGLTGVNYLALQEALEEAGVPTYGQTLTGIDNLILTGRDVEMIDEDKAKIILIYTHLLNEGQEVEEGILFGEISSNINQITTNLNKDGETITVSHTYPTNVNAPGYDADYAGKTITQGGEIQIYIPQKTLRIQCLKEVRYPFLIINNIESTVNKEEWIGGGAREWMCTAANFKPYDIDTLPAKSLFTFEFQHNPDTWDAYAVFIDQRTGKPIAGLVDGVGKKTIPIHKEVDFDEIIGAWIWGGVG